MAIKDRVEISSICISEISEFHREEKFRKKNVNKSGRFHFHLKVLLCVSLNEGFIAKIQNHRSVISIKSHSTLLNCGLIIQTGHFTGILSSSLPFSRTMHFFFIYLM